MVFKENREWFDRLLFLLEMKKATCKTSGFSHIFIGTQLFDVSASNNEDHKVWRPL